MLIHLCQSPNQTSISCPNSIISKMKSFKQVVSILVAIAKAKSMAVKSKTSAIKTRLMIFKLLRDKKVLMSAISHKIHAVIKGDEKVEDYNKAFVPYNRTCTEPAVCVEEDYLDLTNSLLDLNLEEEDGNELGDSSDSVVDFIRNAWEEETDLSLENEIDKAADVFIRRFHTQMRIQKQESFKRYQEMLEKSV